MTICSDVDGLGAALRVITWEWFSVIAPTTVCQEASDSVPPRIPIVAVEDKYHSTSSDCGIRKGYLNIWRRISSRKKVLELSDDVNNEKLRNASDEPLLARISKRVVHSYLLYHKTMTDENNGSFDYCGLNWSVFPQVTSGPPSVHSQDT
ncbi:hypothetical protein L211DRAFT_847529 [Terfezia boudieri ATCC MYA-4762]|uniref:Uncharacterized protein n=1 Tax=Terfezia boudieri ATCC MYA-4762 TaxID=1051890 RepID=A0A3N4LU15_9PEZI|nr:hypothetical protein L211DRAFT_847529 [Terfezia boudieri ATCC MYA-4762]